MDHQTLLQQELESLLDRIEHYRSEDQLYDEWQDLDACSILVQLDSPEFEPLFSGFESIVEEIRSLDSNFEVPIKSLSLGAPTRAIKKDEYGQTYVSYFYESRHLNNLEDAIISALNFLKRKEI